MRKGIWPVKNSDPHVAWWSGNWTCDSTVDGLTPAILLLGSMLEQVVRTLVPLSPSSIIWYQPRGSDALWLGR